MLLLFLKLHRNKNVIIALAAVCVFLFGTQRSYAAHAQSDHRIAYHTQLGQDLDGDHLPETATIRQCGHHYQVSIHFTTGRPKVHLKTFVTQGVAGLSFHTTDINNDSKGDLVIISATSIRPIAIWVNQGRARFKKVPTGFYRGIGRRYSGPTYQFRGASQPEPVGNLSVEPLPQITPATRYFSFDDEIITLVPSQPVQRPFDSLLRQEPPRGPPATDHV